MIIGQLALIAAAFYAGLAIYINLVEQPARLSLDNQGLLSQWKVSYTRGHVMGASTASITGLLGITAFVVSHNWFYLIAAGLILTNWPYTLAFIMPINKKILATPTETANHETRNFIEKWANLHAVRSLLGIAATILFLLAVNH